MKIDLVYLWVDGNDIDLKKKREFWQKKEGKLPKSSTTSARFRDNDELKYSLRSVEKFAPWINHIFIVTDNQTPKWLNTKNKKVSIIDHKDIVPEYALPTFNNRVLTANIHKIPNLSEHFLFANDDTMLGQELTPDYFFTKTGTPIILVKRKSLPNNSFTGSGFNRFFSSKSGYGKATHKARNLIFEKFEKKYFCEPCHNIVPMKKSIITETIKTFKDIFDKTERTKFRHDDNIQEFIYTLYGNATNQTILIINKTIKGEKLYKYDFKKRDDILYKIKKLFIGERVDTLDGANILNNIKKYKPKLFCINDGARMTDTQREKNSNFLKSFFPTKSKFEK